MEEYKVYKIVTDIYNEFQTFSIFRVIFRVDFKLSLFEDTKNLSKVRVF